MIHGALNPLCIYALGGIGIEGLNPQIRADLRQLQDMYFQDPTVEHNQNQDNTRTNSGLPVKDDATMAKK